MRLIKPKDRPCRRETCAQTERYLGEELHGSLDAKCMNDASDDDNHRQSHVHTSPRLWRQAQLATEEGDRCSQEQRPHRDNAPVAEWGGRAEKQSVNDVGRAGDPKPHNMKDHSQHESKAQKSMDLSGAAHAQSGQKTRSQQRLQKQQAQRRNPRKAASDIHRVAPCKKRARRRQGDRDDKQAKDEGPDQ